MLSKEKKLSAKKLRSLLSYDPSTGIFHWLEHRGSANVGDVAGSLDSEGYRQIFIAGSNYRAGRLAWLYITGKWPKKQIDHKNTDRADNSWNNLRQATNTQNQRNRSLNGNSNSGIKGVHWFASGRKWKAMIGYRHRQIYLGSFGSKEEAAKAYASAAKRLFGEFAKLT